MTSTTATAHAIPAGRRLNKDINPIGFEPRVLYGQGKRATTILSGEGYVCPIIAHDAKNDGYDRMRASTAAYSRLKRGVRPMHVTTMHLTMPPWEPDYTTTNKQFHGGSKTLEPATQRMPKGGMRRSQIVFGGFGSAHGYPGHDTDDPNFWKTDYTQTYFQKDIIPANRLHLTSFVNRINQTEGMQAKEVVRPGDHPMSSFTQYKRVHDKLGHLLGPGIARDYPVREQYNILTGEVVGHAWKPENHRMSGNRVLHGVRSAQPQPVIQ